MVESSIVLSCQNLSKTYLDGELSVSVLKEIDFSVAAGEKIAITGASGSGKSTLLHVLAGLDSASAGDVVWQGRSIAGLSDDELSLWRNRFMGFIYQFHHLLPEFNVLENVAMPLWISGVSALSAQDRAAALLDRVGLLHRLKHRVGELSGGERQRVAIARALVTKPQIVLADEPTGNLDSVTAETVLQLMMDLNKELNTSLVWVTHNVSQAKQMDRCLMIQSGKIG